MESYKNSVNKTNSKPFALLILMLCLTVILYASNWNINVYILFSIIIVIACVLFTKIDILHPLCWFIPIFVIYQIAYPCLKLLGIDVYINQNLNDNYVIINWIALICVSTCLLTIKQNRYEISKITKFLNNKNLILIFAIVCLVSIIGLGYIITKGYNNKYDLTKTTDFVVEIIMIILNTITFFAVAYCLSSNSTRKGKILIFIISSILLFMAVGIVGERDLLIKHLIVFLLYYTTIYKLSKKKTIILILTILIFLTFSSSLKMFLTRQNSYNDSESVLVKILTSDFQSSGFNFNYLLNHKDWWEYKKGGTLIYDILSPFRGIIRINSNMISTSWYQTTFWNNRKTGLGFSFLAEGYINFDIMGMIIWCLILCGVIKVIYKKSKKSMYWYLAYINFCPMCMYIMRADLANLISPMVKYVFLGILILYFVCSKKESGEQNE